MTGRVVVTLVLCLGLLNFSLAEEDKQVESKEHNVAPNDDLETAETADIYYAFKSKLESLFNPLKNFKRGVQPSYRQYYGTPTYGVPTYQYTATPNFKQQIWDCFTNGNSYGSGSLSSSGNNYYPGGGGAYYSGSAYYPGSSSGYYPTSGSGYYPSSGSGYSGGSYVPPTKSYFIGGKPAFGFKGNGGGASGLQGTFGASVSASIGGNGDVGYSSAYNTPGYSGFKPSKSLTYSYGTPSYVSNYYNGNEPKSAFPTASYFYSNTVPRIPVPQYVQNTQPLQDAPPASVSQSSQGIIFSSTPKPDIDVSTQSPPTIVSVYVPESSQSPEIYPGGVPVNPPTSVVPIPSTTERPTSQPITITQRPQYNTQNGPSTPGSVLSIYSTDTYLSQPIYSPGFPHGNEGFIGGRPVNSQTAQKDPSSTTGFFYYVPVYYNLANNPPVSGEFQLVSPPGVAGSGSQASGIVYPTSTQASPHENCH